MRMGHPVQPTSVFFSVHDVKPGSTLFHTGSLGRKYRVHMMSAVLIIRLDVIVKAPEAEVRGKKYTWEYHPPR